MKTKIRLPLIAHITCVPILFFLLLLCFLAHLQTKLAEYIDEKVKRRPKTWYTIILCRAISLRSTTVLLKIPSLLYNFRVLKIYDKKMVEKLFRLQEMNMMSWFWTRIPNINISASSFCNNMLHLC